MVLFHICGGRVLLNGTGMFRILVNPVINEAGVVGGEARFEKLEEPANLHYFCCKCNAEVVADEMKTPCSHCGELTPVDATVKKNNVGGYYCGSCAEKLGISGNTLKSILSNLVCQ